MGEKTISANGATVTIGSDIPELTVKTVELRYSAQAQHKHNKINHLLRSAHTQCYRRQRLNSHFD